ncbi:MAG: tryptophan synthase subunit alpha [Lentisphaeria bacterium]|nr:tryptophan synthase subunit alpha [Lentisphaeria bacterium]NQZ69292.1 tryptophan synthase subunit alpha [Lentisphaeria bacterium]
MNRLDQFFAKKQKAFIPYLTAGYPSIDETVGLMHLLVDNGSDILELGFPFSDPTADGPTIQDASQVALDNGFRRTDYFDIVKKFRESDTETPIVCFTYYNPIFKMGCDEFAKTVAELGVDALLVVDLPFEEQDELLPSLEANGLYLIELIAPTTPLDRKAEIVKNGKGFIYQISLKGVTGARAEIAENAAEQAQETKSLTDLPVCMGFGVSTKEQAAKVAAASDGVVVGSAIIKAIAYTDGQRMSEKELDDLASFVKELADATHG